MKIALVAHDQKKAAMIDFVNRHREFLAEQWLVATATTGKHIIEGSGLNVHLVMSGPLGGDVQVSALAATGQLDAVIFLRDPLTAQPHEPDISALLRICDVHSVPLATNLGTAELLLCRLSLRGAE
jgi:methylglyoxal synthase